LNLPDFLLGRDVDGLAIGSSESEVGSLESSDGSDLLGLGVVDVQSVGSDDVQVSIDISLHSIGPVESSQKGGLGIEVPVSIGIDGEGPDGTSLNVIDVDKSSIGVEADSVGSMELAGDHLEGVVGMDSPEGIVSELLVVGRDSVWGIRKVDRTVLPQGQIVGRVDSHAIV